MLAVQECMRGEVNDPVLVQLRVEYRLAARSEIERLETARLTGFGNNRLGFASAERQSGKVNYAGVCG